MFLSENVIFLYILKIFFTMLDLKIFLEYCIILYIFRISLCETSPLHGKKFFQNIEKDHISTQKNNFCMMNKIKPV